MELTIAGYLLLGMLLGFVLMRTYDLIARYLRMQRAALRNEARLKSAELYVLFVKAKGLFVQALHEYKERLERENGTMWEDVTVTISHLRHIAPSEDLADLESAITKTRQWIGVRTWNDAVSAQTTVDELVRATDAAERFANIVLERARSIDDAKVGILNLERSVGALYAKLSHELYAIGKLPDLQVEFEILFHRYEAVTAMRPLGVLPNWLKLRKDLADIESAFRNILERVTKHRIAVEMNR